MRPLIACSTACYGKFGIPASIEHIRAVGLSAIQLVIHNAGQRSPTRDEQPLTAGVTDAELSLMQNQLAANDIQVVSCHIASGNPLAQDTLELILRKLDIAHALGARTVVGDAGDAESPSDRETLYAHLRQIGDRAGELGMVYCLNTTPGICLNHRRMINVMGDLNHPAIRLNFDPGNMLFYNEDPIVEVALAKMCHLVSHITLKDSAGEYGIREFPALGYGGAVDFLRIYQIMRDMAYTGPFVIWIEEAKRDTSLSQHQKSVKNSLGTLRECGYFDVIAG